MAFCTDTDLLYWEPNLFRDGAAAAQTLASGLATIAGTAVTVSGVSLADAGVKALDVIYVGTAPTLAAFPIVSVDSDTQLTISALYDGLFPEDGSAGTASHAGSASSQSFVVRTFYPMRRVVTGMLLQAAGLTPRTHRRRRGW